ncbi:MAG: hypothetical protein Q9208_000286 [Pyrenodesmia sp. 3 TL-2023]
MDWFIQKALSVHTLFVLLHFLTTSQGATVEENKPQRLSYERVYPVSGPVPSVVGIEIYACADNDSLGPSIYQDARVQGLVTVSADLSRIPLSQLPRTRGADGQLYYKIVYEIEITYHSGYTTYELIHDGINYGPIAAEYV